MKQTIYILTIFFLTSCINKKTNEYSQTLVNSSSSIQFPIEAKFKNPNRPIEDTLIATVDNTNFLITPEGKMFWGQNPADTMQLLTSVIVEKVFLHLSGDTLFIFYTETDHEGATSILEKINLKQRQRIWSADIQGFNMGLPYIINDIVYVTTTGVVGKLDLKSGKYLYQYFDLYDDKKYSFNSFDTIIFKDSLTIFLSNNMNGKRVDSLIVNEKTGSRTIRK